MILPIITQAQLYKTFNGNIKIFSSAPLEDIKAESNLTTAFINIKTLKMAFSVKINSFEFPNKLMQEHFNEKYMESDKKGYEIASFIGSLDKVDLTKDGTYNVIVTGKLKIHNVENPRTIMGTIVVGDGKIKIFSNFKVRCADHNIEIPKLVISKIAEEIDVTVNAELSK